MQVRLVHGLVLSTCLCACEASERPRAVRASAKQTLFADRGLVPTREGERIRRELAHAGEIEATLVRIDGVSEARASVSLDAEVPTIVVVVASEGVREETLRETAARLVPGATAAGVYLVVGPGSGEAPRRTRIPALALVLLALGVSLGITFERVRVRNRPVTR